MKKIELLHFTVAKNWVSTAQHLLDTVEQLSLFCHLARINWIRAVDKFCVEQLISCQKCRQIDCWAIKFRAVHPHSLKIIEDNSPIWKCLYIFIKSTFWVRVFFLFWLLSTWQIKQLVYINSYFWSSNCAKTFFQIKF